MLDQLNYLLRKVNLKITPQRKAILEILLSSKGHHLEVEEIHELLTSKDTTRHIGLATVYRNMELFHKAGLVSRLAMDNSSARYELVWDDGLIHHHLICLKCGQLEELEDSLTDQLKARIFSEKGFEVAHKSMKIFGYCRNCKRQLA